MKVRLAAIMAVLTAANGLSSAPTPVAAQAAGAAPLALRVNDPTLRWGPCPPIYKGDCEIAVLHGDPAMPNADVFLKVGGGTELIPHRHTSAERMILISGRLRVEYKGAQPKTLGVGDYAYGPAGLPHRANCLGKQSCTLFIAFEGPVDADPLPLGIK
jgi:quercetin dioxygenase-like cupin family protein